MIRLITIITALVLFTISAGAQMSEDFGNPQTVSDVGKPEASSDVGKPEASSDFGQDELMQALPGEVRGALDENNITPDNAGALSLNPFSVLRSMWDIILDEIAKPMKMFAGLTAVILLCAAVEALKDSAAGNTGTGEVFNIVGVLAGAGMMCVYVADIVMRSAQTLQTGSLFLLTFVPIFAGIMAAAGQLTTASVFAASLVGAGQVFAYITSTFLAPLVSCVLGLSVAGAVNPELKIDRLAETVRKITVWTLGLLVTVFVGLLSLQSFISTSADTVALKAARFAVSNTVPIVGSAVGDALATVRGSINILRGSTGTFGIIAGLMVAVPTLASVFFHKLALAVAAAICDIFGIHRLSVLLRSGENVVTIIFAMLFCFILLVVISVALMLFIWNGAV